ncbi:GH3 auxin-responsive promoter family protein [Echinicola vietnamensis]|uniref:Acyl-CoA synthetase (AMP-forming)/AMP-acid ligase II n=1 Tax=Echinicola vietnamensis (strain DSM 17526 / LMG 23754 / KMM 6221) TaxID=926556 RepID=L0FY95_ECHVK|nr:GH3 auxin-responsive promoter family protein [Echinicola vietnamensis]AGA77605.1 acyl-CoA synthetase (AMP-forming)/AMP-acid ligase II [Echinicola vietnamensis DSM 17526]
MDVLNTFMTWIFKIRIGQIDNFKENPIEVQQDIFFDLIKSAKKTQFGKKYGFADIKSPKDFDRQVPVHSYEQMQPYIEQTMRGEQNVIWPSEISWFSKSSGTTSSRSKFIPVSQESLEDCHFKGGKDMLSLYVNNYPDSKLFTGKSLAIGGSSEVNRLDNNKNSHYGDISAVIMRNLPVWAQLARTPSLETALMSEWEEKIEKMARETMEENVLTISGVPTWTIVLLQRILELTNSKSILEVWPNLEVFFHGAVAFGPYRRIFEELIPSSQMHYMETYNASEGFFGIQDQKNSDELLLMLDYGIYYEFIPMEEWDSDDPKVLPLEAVELGKNYALVISTNGGLWRYKIGDTVKFTSIRPYRIRISGRTKHFINAFGEEVIVENAEKAIEVAAEATDAKVVNFTAAPVYFEGSDSKGAHEWIIEFSQAPSDEAVFKEKLDATLREVNSDYDAKRYRDIALDRPKVHFAAAGLFEKWMKSRGKLGGQNKVPRLANNREYIDAILELMK